MIARADEQRNDSSDGGANYESSVFVEPKNAADILLRRTYARFSRAKVRVAAEHTIPCANSMAKSMPYVGPAPRIIAPSLETVIAVVIACALRHVRHPYAWLASGTNQVKSIEQTKATCPVTLAHPVTQLARAEYFGGASLAEK
jgi:hypothetical protein